MNAFATIARLTAAPFSVGTTGHRTQRAVLFTGLLLAICALALTASFATSASAAPDGPPIIVNDEPTPDVHDPPIDDKAPVPTPEPTAEPLDDKAPPPSPEPDPNPDPIDDEIIPAPDEDPGQPSDEPGVPVITALPDTGSGPMLSASGLTAQATISLLVIAGFALIGAGCQRTMARKETTR